MNTRLLMGILMIALLAGVGTVSAAPNLVTNGGFESPVLVPNSEGFLRITSGLTGWTIGPGNIDTVGPYWTPSEGVQSIDLSGSRRGTIKQNIPTEPGKLYDLSFDLSGNPVGLPTQKSVEVFWNGVSQGISTFSTTGHTQLSMGWETEGRLLLPSTGTSTELRFVDRSDGNGFYGVALDNIIVTEHKVIPSPEFPSMALPMAFIVGIIGAVLFVKNTKEN
jgi:choice-of-anchor C domain-containing protein